VKSDGERVELELGRAVDQIAGSVRDVVGRILVRVRVEIDLQHAAFTASRSAAAPRSSSREPSRWIFSIMARSTGS
jgi:hypothetical protein